MDLSVLIIMFIVSGIAPLFWARWIILASREEREEKKPLNLVKRKDTARGPTPSEIAKKGYSPSISIQDIDCKDI